MGERTRKRGDTYPDRFLFKDADGAAVDLTGWTNFQLTINPEKTPVDDSGQLLQLTGAITGAATLGVVEFAWLDADANQTPGTYWYDVQAIMANGKRRTWGPYKYIFAQDINKD
jgi:hypothetical protein